jgi:A/G-specific adenine glycosylase
VRAQCQAHRQGRTAELPVVPKKQPPQRRELVALVAVQDHDEAGTAGSRLLLQRSSSGLFAGLWNLPMHDGNDRKAARLLMTQLELRGKLAAQPAATVEHVLTHRKLQVQLYRVALQSSGADPGLRLQPRSRLSELGTSSLTHKALAALEPPAQLPLVE